MTNRSNYLTVGLAVAFLAILVGYVMMYYAMLEGATYDNRTGTTNSYRCDPFYRAEGHVISALLLPAHMLDRIVRPSRWAPLELPPIEPAA